MQGLSLEEDEPESTSKGLYKTNWIQPNLQDQWNRDQL